MADDIVEPSSAPRWLTCAGVMAAILASSCCVVPLVLVLLGISGAWIGNLTALEPYKPYFVAAALIFIGLAFRQVYFRPRGLCDGSYCASPASSVVVRSALWFATALVVIAATVDWWAPLFY